MIPFDFTKKVYTEGTNSSTNNYFLGAYNNAGINRVRTFILGPEADLQAVPVAERSITTNGISSIRILSGDTTYIRTGYNANTSMVINIRDFKIYRLNQYGVCENIGTKSIGKGYLSFENYNEL